MSRRRATADTFGVELGREARNAVALVRALYGSAAGGQQVRLS
ncbi:MAG TPA: hypothetical protein VK624_18285 [Steroidobacteraceae bacterium]|nr:hypothetical protein [Steroidobacteraceae bacterium]